MMEFLTLSTIKRIAIICGLLLTAFLVGAFVGYVRGTLGDDGSIERAMDWAIKTGWLGMLLIVISTIFGKIDGLVESNWKLPFFVRLAIMTGLLYAIMDGSGVLMKIELGEFWLSILSGFLQGVLGGGIGGILIQKTNKKITI